MTGWENFTAKFPFTLLVENSQLKPEKDPFTPGGSVCPDQRWKKIHCCLLVLIRSVAQSQNTNVDGQAPH